jgi:ABC-type glutathione transport system ATPase component
MNRRLYDIRLSSGNRLIADIRGFPVQTGGITLLFGESGIGKSLLAKSLYGILDTESVSATINGEPYEEHLRDPEAGAMRRQGFFVFQEPSTHLNPLMTIGEQIREGDLARNPDPTGALLPLWAKDEQGSLENIIGVRPTPFRPSGGEKQRVLAGMAFAKMDLSSGGSPEAGGLFVFDEPTGSLDREARDRFLVQLLERHRRNPRQTILLVTHDYSMVGFFERQGSDIRERSTYLELVRRGKEHEVRLFSPSQYIHWIETLRSPRKAEFSGPALLEVEGGISVFGRTFSFSRADRPDTSMSMKVHRGELVYLKAASGVGKTTIAKIIVGIQKSDAFRINIDGTRLGEVSPHGYWRNTLWGKKLTMVFQHADEALNLRSTVEATLKILPVPALQRPEGRREALRALFPDHALNTLLSSRVADLSGGEKQRLNLVRALALQTPLLILDEPLNALDFESIVRVLKAVESLRERGRAILLVSHNEDIFDALVPPGSMYILKASAPSP